MFENLPNELWLQIIQKVENPEPLSQTCKKLNGLAYQLKLKDLGNNVVDGKTAKESYFSTLQQQKESIIHYLMLHDMNSQSNLRNTYTGSKKARTKLSFDVLGFGFEVGKLITQFPYNQLKQTYEKAKVTDLYVAAREERYRKILNAVLQPNFNLDFIRENIVKTREEFYLPYTSPLIKEGLTEDNMSAMAFFEILNAMIHTNAVALIKRILSLYPELANMDFPNLYMDCALIRATFYDREELVALFLKHGADPNKRGKIRAESRALLGDTFQAIYFAIAHLDTEDNARKERVKQIILDLFRHGAILPPLDEFPNDFISKCKECYLETEKLQQTLGPKA